MTYETKTYSDGERQECWMNDVGEYHREDGPAIIYYYNNGNIKEECWLFNSHRHRIDGPAVIYYYGNGNIKEEVWYINDKWHREDGPVDIEYYENGQIYKEEWLINDKYHRLDGPAITRYDEDGKIMHKDYWINDYNITNIVEKIFGDIPNELTKDQAVLLKLSLPEEYFT